MIPKLDQRRKLTSTIKDMSRNRSSDESRSTTRNKKKSLLPNYLLPPTLLYTHQIS
jgi:hypothetical protein